MTRQKLKRGIVPSVTVILSTTWMTVTISQLIHPALLLLGQVVKTCLGPMAREIAYSAIMLAFMRATMVQYLSWTTPLIITQVFMTKKVRSADGVMMTTQSIHHQLLSLNTRSGNVKVVMVLTRYITFRPTQTETGSSAPAANYLASVILVATKIVLAVMALKSKISCDIV